MVQKPPRIELESHNLIWLGVSAGDVQGRPGNSWWCFSKDANKGDLLVLYQKQVGILRIEPLTGEYPIREYRCSDIGLRTLSTSLLFSLTTPITARQLKSDKILFELPAVQRNFQGTTFRFPLESWPRFLALVRSHYGAKKAQKPKAVKKPSHPASKPRKSEHASVSETDLDFYL